MVNNPLHTRVNREVYPDFAAGYINFYPCNGGIILPEFGDKKADAEAKELMESLFPQQRIVQVDIDYIAIGGGGIHCVTMQQPDFTMLTPDE
nr:agmatine deiminase family protein [Xenorhabdus mauleonii]